MSDSLIRTLISNYGLVIALAVLFAIILIRALAIDIKFDLNQFISERKKHHLVLAQSYCPHIRIEVKDTGIEYQTLFYSPLGTPYWICQQCNVQVPIAPDENETRDAAVYFVNNPKRYKRQMRLYQKHMRKAI